VVAVVSYGIVGTVGQAAAGPAVGAVTTASALADDIRVKLPIRYVTDVAASTVRQRVYVGSHQGMAILDLAGQILTTIPGAYSDLTLTPDSSVLYATRLDDTTLTWFYTSTLGRVDVDLGVCPYSSVVTGGKLWFSHASCDLGRDPALGSFDTVTREVRTGLIPLPGTRHWCRTLCGSAAPTGCSPWT
jgi:hypothetical protein